MRRMLVLFWIRAACVLCVAASSCMTCSGIALNIIVGAGRSVWRQCNSAGAGGHLWESDIERWGRKEVWRWKSLWSCFPICVRPRRQVRATQHGWSDTPIDRCRINLPAAINWNSNFSLYLTLVFIVQIISNRLFRCQLWCPGHWRHCTPYVVPVCRCSWCFAVLWPDAVAIN